MLENEWFGKIYGGDTNKEKEENRIMRTFVHCTAVINVVN